MRFDQPHDVQQVLLAFAGAAFGVLPGENLSLQRVRQTRNAHENAVDVRRHRARGEIAIDFFRADLHRHCRSAFEVDRPLKCSCDKARRAQRLHRRVAPLTDRELVFRAPASYGAWLGVRYHSRALEVNLTVRSG